MSRPRDATSRGSAAAIPVGVVTHRSRVPGRDARRGGAPEVAVTGTLGLVLADGGDSEGGGLLALLVILLLLYLLFRK